MSFEPAGSVFVVFRAVRRRDHVVAVKHADGQTGAFNLRLADDGKLEIDAWSPGTVRWQTASGRTGAPRPKMFPSP